MDDVYNTLETNTFDTVDRKAVFASYNNSISDASSNPNIVDACEDGYGSSSTNSSNINSANFIGIVADQNITYPCLVLTQFMEFGTRSSQVTSLQKFLSDTGYLEMWPTGFFGRNTEMGIKIWQQKHAIDVKGWAGPSTRGSIASVTCKGDAASVAKAKRGVVTGSKVVTKTTTSSQVNIPTTVVNTTPTIISSRVVATSSIPATISGKLSQGVGVFYLKRSPINSIYFTYSADTTRDVTYICFEKNGENRCATSTNFTELKSQYSPGDYDAIPTGDRWLITLYYSTAKWGDITTTGGKVYLRSGYNATSDVFFVNNVNALQ
jgi:peptidoglycan hydrolase-like protein with peptidoglycan-binding domain